MTGDFSAADRVMTLAEALELLTGQVVPVDGVERLPLVETLGRVLAEDVVSPLALPPFANSAMDGWAFAHDGRPADGWLSIVGRAAAGHPFAGRVGSGEAVRILTGAPLPEGADSVAMQEDCSAEDGRVRVPPALPPGANVRAAGEDVTAGAVVLAAGRRLRPQDLGMAAAVGRTGLVVRRPLSAALFSTGDEINEPGTVLPEGGIHDSNRFTVAALLRGLGIGVTDLGILPDDPARIGAALAAAAVGHDLILTSGGVSVGDEDHVKAVVRGLGTLHFWRLAIKPGKPVALGRIAGAAFVGLPGNPVAALVTFVAVVRPLLLAMMGARDTPPPACPVPEETGDVAMGDLLDFLPFSEVLR